MFSGGIERNRVKNGLRKAEIKKNLSVVSTCRKPFEKPHTGTEKYHCHIKMIKLYHGTRRENL